MSGAGRVGNGAERVGPAGEGSSLARVEAAGMMSGTPRSCGRLVWKRRKNMVKIGLICRSIDILMDHDTS